MVKIAKYHVFRNFVAIYHFLVLKLCEIEFEQYSSFLKLSSYWVCYHGSVWAEILHIKNAT